MSLTLEKFLAKVKIPGDPNQCWMWQAAKDKDGYGYAWDYENKKQIKAHRLAYKLFYSEDPGELFTCHKCDVTSCINPAHLFLGTNTDNMRDMVKKGRHFESNVTHCPKGHSYKEYGYRRARGSRDCTECRRVGQRDVAEDVRKRRNLRSLASHYANREDRLLKMREYGKKYYAKKKLEEKLECT